MMARPNARNISTQRLATLFCAPCYTRLATFQQQVASEHARSYRFSSLNMTANNTQVTGHQECGLRWRPRRCQTRWRIVRAFRTYSQSCNTQERQGNKGTNCYKALLVSACAIWRQKQVHKGRRTKLLQDFAHVWPSPLPHLKTRSNNVPRGCVEMLLAFGPALRERVWVPNKLGL